MTPIGDRNAGHHKPNPLTLVGAFVGPTRDDRLDEVRLALRELEVEELPFPSDTAVKLVLLHSETGLKMPDCCVLLAAEHVGARLASFDDRVRKAAWGLARSVRLPLKAPTRRARQALPGRAGEQVHALAATDPDGAHRRKRADVLVHDSDRGQGGVGSILKRPAGCEHPRMRAEASTARRWRA